MAEKVLCHFCGKKMTRGITYLSSGLNQISFQCECGAKTIFCIHHTKKIKSIKMHFEYEAEKN